MPQIPYDDPLPTERTAALPQPEKVPLRPKPAALDVAAAAFRQSNLAGALYDRLSAGPRPDTVDPDYSPFDGDIAGFEDHADRFLDSRSREETAFIKQRISSELADKQTLRDAGGWGLAASLTAGLTDPVTLASMALPGAIGVRGGQVLKAVGAQAALDTGAELALHQLQETRTVGESALNISAGAVLTGLLGHMAVRVPRQEFEAARKALGKELVTPDSTAGAAAVARTTMEEETLATGGEAVANTLGKISPGQRLMTSPSLEARRVVQALSETPEQLNKNAAGISTEQAIETRLKRLQGAWYESYRERGQLYRDYRQRVREEGGTALSRRQFNEEIAYAMRRGDQSAIDEVAQAAASTRRRIIEPLKGRAQKAGLLGEGDAVTGAESYLIRQYNVAKIRANQAAWIETLTEGFARKGVDRAEAESIAYQVTRSIMGSERGTLDIRALDDIVPKSGRLKERTLKLDDEVLEPWLVNDIDQLTMAYQRTLGPEIEMVERFGDRDLKDAFEKVKDEYGALKSQAREQKNDALLKQLSKREEADLQDLAAIRDRLYGRFGAPKDPGSFFVRAGRFIRALNYIRLLGGQVVSALTDVPRMMMIYGAPRMAAASLQLATNLKALGLARHEARRMGIGLDLVLNTRGVQLGDIGEYSTFAEQAFMRKASDAFSILSLQSPWNATMKSWASVMSQDDILKAAAKVAGGGDLSKKMVARLASLGIDDDGLRRIAKEAEEHGLHESGLRFGNSEAWTDQRTAQIFESAVLKESDIAILTPGAGDLPLVYSTEWGKALLQFKSFAISSTRRLVTPAVQGLAQGDLRTAMGVAAMFGMGAAVYTLKQLSADRPITDDPVQFAKEAVDRSGMLAWGGDVIFPALWAMGYDDLSRWSDRSAVETIGGPVAGAVADIWQSRFPARILDGDLSQVDTHKLRRFAPGQSLFYLRRPINALENMAAAGTD